MRRVSGRLFAWGILVVLISGLAGCEGILGSQHRIVLFNGKDLSGWKPVVSEGDVAAEQVWSVRDGVIYCTGRSNGYLRTERKYGDYRLHVEWRWPAEPSNSGVLLHASGRDKVWPRCIECQLKADNAGDIVLMNGAGLTADGRNWRDPDKQFVVIRKKQPSNEKPAGQWNEYDIYCQKNAVHCSVNGVIQNEGTRATAAAGRIGLQSEGGPIEFRNIYIEPLN